MKKAKRVVLVITFLTLLLACAAALCVGCERKSELKTPTGLELTSTDVLEWDEVEGAASYTVDINGEEHLTRTNSLDVFEILDSYKTYKIKVAANSEKANVRDSEWSEEMTIEQERPDWFGFLPTEDGRGWDATEIDKSKVKGKLIIPAFFKDKAVMRVTGFSGCGELTGVILPDTVEYVNAFSDCEKLARVRWSAGIQTIIGTSFKNTAIEALVLPEGFKSLYNGFADCKRLKSVNLPSTTERLENVNGIPPFQGCTRLESIEVAEGNEVYKSDGNCIMRRKDDTLVVGCKASVIPAYTEHIGNGAFKNMGVESIVLPDSIISIEDEAFFQNDRLTRVTLPQGLTVVGRRAFACCAALETVELPDTLVSLEAGAFGYCTALQAVELPDEITSVRSRVFTCCTRLREVSFGAGLESISLDAFELCTELERITVSDENPYFKSVNDGKFLLTKTGETLVLGGVDGKIPDGVKTIAYGAFFGRTGLKEIIFPDVLERIGENAFMECAGLTELKLPRGLKEIGDRAFCDCLGLFNIRIPDGVVSLGRFAFTAMSLNEIGSAGASYCYAPLTLTIPDSVQIADALVLQRTGSVVIYTAHASKPSGWLTNVDVVIWGCELAFDDDGLPYVVSMPNAFVDGADKFRMHDRDGWKMVGWAAEKGGSAVFGASAGTEKFVPCNVATLEKYYLYEKIYCFTYHMPTEDRLRASEMGIQRLYAVWEKTN